MLNLDGAACQQEAVWVEPGARSEHLLQALDQAGRWLDIPLVLGTIASDQRQFVREGFAAVGLSIGAAKLHTPADSIEQVQPEALRTAARLLLAPSPSFGEQRPLSVALRRLPADNARPPSHRDARGAQAMSAPLESRESVRLVAPILRLVERCQDAPRGR
ncbi:MAG TPA: M28 family peptidase [Ktedonobacteraceae bacterium]|nr:M28 family peptidase [Ktedonobacteraceae bacterium]